MNYVALWVALSAANPNFQSNWIEIERFDTYKECKTALRSTWLVGYRASCLSPSEYPWRAK